MVCCRIVAVLVKEFFNTHFITGLLGNLCFPETLDAFGDEIERNQIEIRGKTELFFKGSVIKCVVIWLEFIVK